MLLLLRGVLFVGAIGLWFYCVFDVIRSDVQRVRNLHKLIWLAIVLLAPTIGSLAWLLLGRPEALGTGLFAPSPPVRAPDDSPEFLAKLGDEIRRKRPERRPPDPNGASIEEEIRRLEEELRRRSREEGNNDA